MDAGNIIYLKNTLSSDMGKMKIKNLLLPEYLDAICRATMATHLRYVPHIYTVLGAKQQTIQDPLQFQEISRHHSDLLNFRF